MIIIQLYKIIINLINYASYKLLQMIERVKNIAVSGRCVCVMFNVRVVL